MAKGESIRLIEGEYVVEIVDRLPEEFGDMTLERLTGIALENRRKINEIVDQFNYYASKR